MPKTPKPGRTKTAGAAPAAANAQSRRTVPCSNCGKPADVPPDAKPGQRLFCATCTAAWQAGPLARKTT